MISMTKKDYELILEHAKSCVPEEACGLIAGVKNGDDKEIKKEGNASVLGIQYKSKIFKDDDFSVDDDGRWNAISLLECKEIQLYLSRPVDNDLNQAKGSLSFDSEDIITLFGPQVTVIRNIINVMHNSVIAA